MGRNCIEVTDGAWAHFERLSHSIDSNRSRVGLKPSGCSGFKYLIEVDTEGTQPGDELIEHGEVTLIVDAKAIMKLLGTKLDYTDNGFETKLEFDNPQERGRCGCGESVAL